jgi:hypothetical protein
VPDWAQRLRSWLSKAIARPGGGDYQRLRSMALDVEPTTIALPDGEPWSGALVAAMEIGLRNGIATIVAIADGTVSMYVSAGGGVLGAGGHAAVRAAAERFRTVAAESRGLLDRADGFPLPAAGQVRFHARTADGAYSGEAPEAALRTTRHPLAPLYAAGQDLLTEIRLSTER